MIYDFKVSLDVYNLFLEDNEKVDKEYLDCINKKYSEFRIKYNDNPDVKSISILQVLEGLSSDNQILLIGVRDNVEYISGYYFIGEDCDDNIYYAEDMKVFNEIMKYKIG